MARQAVLHLHGQRVVMTGRIYFRPFWESNGNWYTGWSPCSSGTTTSFVAAWRRVHDIFTSVGLDNSHVAWVYSVNWNSSCSAGDPVNTYPGSNYVDWLGIDGYNTFTGPSSTPTDVFGPMVSKLSTVDPTKPIGLDEAGADSVFGTQDKNQYINEYFPYVANNNIRMAVWFNENFGYSVPPGTTQTNQWAIFEQEYPQDALPSYGDQSFQYTVTASVPNVAHVSAHTYWRGFSAYQAGVQSSSLVGSCGADSCSPPGHIQSTQQFLGQ